MKVFHRNPVAQPAPQAGNQARHRERGIALVVTLILLSVVTFLAVAFLFLARREAGAVGTTVAMTAARRAADAAAENARAQVIASLISSNQFYYRMIVSTNYINTNGFVPNSASLTNVNYDYVVGGSTNFTLDQRNQNIADLYYAPRVPVFVRTNRNGAGEFRFYHDLNQNGRFDTNGLMLEIGHNGRPLQTVDPNDNRIPITNFFVGDPEWIGGLERPDRPHSASNRFVFRYCFIAVPSGKTLDVNTLHNQAKFPRGQVDGFLRNMGVGPWEMNLASFLVDLNTNVWHQNPGFPGSLPTAYINPAPYFYDPTFALQSTGTAFEDAVALTRYRYGGNWSNLKSVFGMFGAAGERAFLLDGADDYSSGPLLLTNTTPAFDGDTATRVRLGWPGAENPNHFFTTQDLFDRTKTTGTGQVTPNTFADRLLNASYYGVSFYDRYTYYRLLSQLGTDSPPDPALANKINLNYINVDTNGQVIPDMQTNFWSWNDPLQFFTNAADRLLRSTFTDTNANMTNFGASLVTLTNIPVLVSNRFVYTPSVHRILQVTANIWDSTTNRLIPNGTDYPFLPSVFRPVFRKEKNKLNTSIDDIYISGFVEVGAVTGTSDPQFIKPMDLNDPADLATTLGTLSGSPSGQTLNIYGVPWVIGAKKGFPNFNEFAMQTISQMTRKLQFRRTSETTKPFATNQMFILGVSNTFAFEAWNSYSADYSRDVQIIVANDMSMNLAYTNDISVNPSALDTRSGYEPRPPSLLIGRFTVTTNVLDIPANIWKGSSPRRIPVSASFLVPLQTNIVLLPDSIYRTEPTPFFTTNSNAGASLWLGFEQTKKFPIPQFNVNVSNRVRFIMLDKKTQRVVDYVQLGGLNGLRDLTAESTKSDVTFVDATTGESRNEAIFWNPNRLQGNTSLFSVPEGVNNQIRASKSEIDVPDWKEFGIGQANRATQQKGIDDFRVFMGLSPRWYPGTVNTNLTMQAPFSPTRKTSQYITWQANDPLVHYTAGDLANLSLGNGITREQPNGPIQPIKNIGALNDRYEPWSGRPSSSAADKSQSGMGLFSLEAKDPGVTRPDNWNFPTNKFATVGLLGRVHRGTPWQTVYLKANDIGVSKWTNWTGNANFLDATMTRPVMDRTLVDVFTTAIDKNSTLGQLNVNQTGIAAWSALLGGVIGLTNSSTDAELQATPPVAKLQAFIIDPAGVDPSGPTNSILGKIHDAVDRTRAAAPFNGSFKHLGDILAVPELTTASPLLNTNTAVQLQEGINDAVYERLPQQLLGLMRGGDQPSFTIYAYGQALQPAPRSIVTSGPYFGLCTNYQITAEFATRTVVRIEGAPSNPKAVVESFNILPPE